MKNIGMNYAFFVVIVAIGVGGFFLYSNFSSTREGDVLDHQDEAVESFEIYPGEVVKKIMENEDIVLLDVRTIEEYGEVHLENALLLPVQELSQKTLDGIGLGESAKDKEIIIYCRSGARSKTAYQIMEQLGYTNIKSVSGGMIHWMEDDYPFTEVGVGSGGLVTSDEARLDGPKITLDRSFHNFGVIPQHGGAVEAVFTVKNDGTEILEVGDITTSCSCTSAEISSRSISAGEEATLRVLFDPDFHEEPLDVFKRTVFIPTNDPNIPEAEVVIEVDIAEGE